MNTNYFSPVVWDDREMKFIPSSFMNAPMFGKEYCLELCEQLTEIASSSWEPRQGEIYYHPVTWASGLMFIPMDNQASFDGCPYPAFKTLEECQMVCDKMNHYLISCSTKEIQPDAKIEEQTPEEQEMQKIGDILREKFGN